MSDIESKLDLKSQYDRCFNALKEAGILKTLPQQAVLGIIGIDGQEYPIPAYEQVREVAEARKTILEEKMAQGFIKLQLTPVALPFELFQKCIVEQIRRHFIADSLFYTGTNKLIIELRQFEPSLWIWDGWKGGEKTGGVRYYPGSYDKNHGGITKSELLEKTKNTPFPGWIPILIEDMIFLPRSGQSKVIGGRKQLENNRRPVDYLEILRQEPYYKYESGWIIEDWFAFFAQRLETTNQVSNDWDDFNAMWLLGNYHESSCTVPRGHWARHVGKAHIDRDNFNNHREMWGAATAVKIAEI